MSETVATIEAGVQRTEENEKTRLKCLFLAEALLLGRSWLAATQTELAFFDVFWFLFLLDLLCFDDCSLFFMFCFYDFYDLLRLCDDFSYRIVLPPLARLPCFLLHYTLLSHLP